MARLIYSAIASLDGYVEDEHGGFAWAAPDEEVHAFANELERPIGTHLYGRRMYETMSFWETNGDGPEEPAVMRDFASLWREAEKVVYSRTLEQASTARTRIEPEFDPEAVRRLKDGAERDLSIGGPGLAAHALAAGLVDELHLILVPVAVGRGKPALPLDSPLRLELLDQCRFGNGTVYLRYRIGSSPTSVK